MTVLCVALMKCQGSGGRERHRETENRDREAAVGIERQRMQEIKTGTPPCRR